MILTGKKNGHTGREPCHSATVSFKIHTLNDVGSNPDLRCERTVTNHLNRDTAQASKRDENLTFLCLITSLCLVKRVKYLL